MSTGLKRGMGSLSNVERSRLASLEADIREGIETAIVIAEKIHEIWEDRLYRETHDSFESYMADRWGLSRSRGYQFIAAARAMQELPEGTPKPTNINQALSLVGHKAATTPPAPAVDEDAGAAAIRANGHVPAGEPIHVDRPDAVPEQAEPEPTGQTDKEWLATMPARAALSERNRALFDDEALAFRATYDLKDAYRDDCQATTKPLEKRHTGRYMPWLGRHKLHYLILGPEKWQACTDCSGTGFLSLLNVTSQCGTCRGAGYHVG